MEDETREVVLAGFGCAGFIALCLLLGLVISGLRDAPRVDITPQWWATSELTQTARFADKPIREPLLRILLLSLIGVPIYWLATEYVKESKAGFETTTSLESFLWWSWIKEHPWQERYALNVAGKLGITYSAIFAVPGVIWCLIELGSYVITGNCYYLEYSLVMFSFVTITMGVAAVHLTAPISHLLSAESMLRRLWALIVIAFEVLGMLLTARDILNLWK